MNVLAIDTASEAMGLAVATRDGRRLVTIHRAGLRHAESLAPAISTILMQAEVPPPSLDLLICSTGPGSFTGVRIGMATAKGLALGARCAVVGVSSLDALASRFSFFEGTVAPLVDAKKGRVYAALYVHGERASEYLDLEPEGLARLLLAEAGEGSLLLTGPLAGAFRKLLDRTPPATPGRPTLYADPGPADTDPLALLQIGVSRFRMRGPDPEPLAPLYLRPSEAELKAAKGLSGSEQHGVSGESRGAGST